jgi:hypothetical protein
VHGVCVGSQISRASAWFPGKMGSWNGNRSSASAPVVPTFRGPIFHNTCPNQLKRSSKNTTSTPLFFTAKLLSPIETEAPNTWIQTTKRKESLKNGMRAAFDGKTWNFICQHRGRCQCLLQEKGVGGGGGVKLTIFRQHCHKSNYSAQ